MTVGSIRKRASRRSSSSRRVIGPRFGERTYCDGATASTVAMRQFPSRLAPVTLPLGQDSAEIFRRNQGTAQGDAFKVWVMQFRHAVVSGGQLALGTAGLSSSRIHRTSWTRISIAL